MWDTADLQNASAFTFWPKAYFLGFYSSPSYFLYSFVIIHATHWFRDFSVAVLTGPVRSAMVGCWGDCFLPLMLPLWYITSSSSVDLEFNGALFSKHFHYTAERSPLIPACCIGVARLATDNFFKMIWQPVFYRLWSTLLVGMQPWPKKHM